LPKFFPIKKKSSKSLRKYGLSFFFPKLSATPVLPQTLCWNKKTTTKNDDAYPLPSVDGKTMIEEEEEVDQREGGGAGGGGGGFLKEESGKISQSVRGFQTGTNR
jgi:hypothetical protein